VNGVPGNGSKSGVYPLSFEDGVMPVPVGDGAVTGRDRPGRKVEDEGEVVTRYSGMMSGKTAGMLGEREKDGI
jgi:hypothetical protein